MDSDDEYYIKKLKTKGKTQAFLTKPDTLELLPRTRQGKCVGAASEPYNINQNKLPTDASQGTTTHTFITNDIWFHIAQYISPEDVKNYSLVCIQSANSVNSRLFWLQIYRRYCQQSSGNNRNWVLDLPEDFQLKHLRDCDRNTLRQKVIQALYKCYPPFKKRLNNPYTLDLLVGRLYVSSWYKLLQCLRIMCYKFQLKFSQSCESQKSQESNIFGNNTFNSSGDYAENWESLADEPNNNWCKVKQSHSTTSSCDLDGVYILVVCSERFGPFPTDMICSHDTNSLRFAAGRELLSTDMISKTLELDFVSTTKSQTITVRYLKVHKFKVIPWWHPDFKTFIKCE